MNAEKTNCEVCGELLAPFPLDQANLLLRCRACGHIIRPLESAPASMRQHAWGGVGLFDHLRTALTWRSQRRFLKSIGFPHPLRVLEIGFGAGLMLKRHIAQGARCSGVERELLETEISKGVVEAIHYQRAAAEEMDFPPESFDLIYAIHVAEHLQEPDLVFKKIYQLLAPHGALHLMTPNGASLGLRLFKTAWWNLEDPTHLRFYSPESITRLLASAGFSEIEVKQPLWDSLLLEGASTARLVLHRELEHGVLSLKRGKAIALLSSPFFLLGRALISDLNPSIEIWARKGTGSP